MDNQKVKLIKLTDIVISPDNVRKDIDQESIIELAMNIREFKQLQPVLLTGKEPKYELIIGQRRYLAIIYLSKKYGNWKHIEAVFTERRYSKIEKVVISLAENIQRSQLTFKDTRNAISAIFKEYKNVKRVSSLLGISEGTVYNYLKIEQYATPRIKTMIEKGDVTKDDVMKAIRLSKGNIKETIAILKKMRPMNPFEKKRALEIVRDNPNKSGYKILEEAKKPKYHDSVTLNLSVELSSALNKASDKLQEERSSIATNALRVWLKENGFLT